MRVPKTRLSAKRCIHPKFIFAGADFFFFLMKGEWELEDTQEADLSCRPPERGLARRAEQREQQGQARPQPPSGFLEIPGILTTRRAGLGGGGPRLDEHPDHQAPLRTPALLAEMLPPTLQNKSPKANSEQRVRGRERRGRWLGSRLGQCLGLQGPVSYCFSGVPLTMGPYRPLP